NLIPLCDGGSMLRAVAAALAVGAAGHEGAPDQSPVRQPEWGRFIRDVGCHQLVDSGFLCRAKVRAMGADRPNWGKHADARASISGALNGYDIDVNPGAGRNNLFRLALARVESEEEGSEEWAEALCVFVGMARRFSGKQKEVVLRKACDKLRDWIAAPTSFSP